MHGRYANYVLETTNYDNKGRNSHCGVIMEGKNPPQEFFFFLLFLFRYCRCTTCLYNKLQYVHYRSYDLMFIKNFRCIYVVLHEFFNLWNGDGGYSLGRMTIFFSVKINKVRQVPTGTG